MACWAYKKDEILKEAHKLFTHILPITDSIRLVGLRLNNLRTNRRHENSESNDSYEQRKSEDSMEYHDYKHNEDMDFERSRMNPSGRKTIDQAEKVEKEPVKGKKVRKQK
jgi:hypothetical protein